MTQSDSADLKVFSTCQSTGLVEELVVFILDFGTRPVKRKTLQAEKRREDAAELSEVALQFRAQDFGRRPLRGSEGRNPAPLEFRTFDRWQQPLWLLWLLIWPGPLTWVGAEPELDSLDATCCPSPRRYCVGPSRSALHRSFVSKMRICVYLCSSFDFGSFCQP